MSGRRARFLRRLAKVHKVPPRVLNRAWHRKSRAVLEMLVAGMRAGP